MSGCTVKKCTCKAEQFQCAEYQVKKYGNQMRVMNYRLEPQDTFR